MTKTQLVHIRMPVAFHRKLARDAERSGLTLNAEILRRLEQSYEIGDQLNSAVEKLSEMSAEIRARVQARKEPKP
jgi:hypothetical protein